MSNPIVNEANNRMSKAVGNTTNELAKIRTGKASPVLLDGVKVVYYGSPVSLKQIATISTPEPRMIAIQPYEKNMISTIEKAIMTADLGLNPQNDGTIIRVPIPPLNEERRQEYVKLCGKITEEGRIAIRNVRRDAMDKLKKAKKDGELAEDAEKKLEKEVQKATDSHIAQLDEILKRKQDEIMEV